ncbi:glycosyltransferase family 4 protein [Patescibacteria group bacterium]|nr:glycosyltransferase family 4 protein [Patescibacteria group bacterium]
MFGWELPPFNSGGLGTACYGLTKSLSNKGMEISFVLPKKVNLNLDFMKLIFGETDDMPMNPLFSNPYLSSKSSKEALKSKSLYYANSLIGEVLRYASVAGDIAKKENFDVIHAHDWLTMRAGIEAKKATGKPLIVQVHATEFDRTGGNNNQLIYELEKEGMEAADIVITVSNYTKGKVVEHYGINPNKIRVVHNGVDFEDYGVNELSELKRKNKIVLFLGRITLQKGPDYFIYAAKKVLDYMEDVLFIVAGSGDMQEFMINKSIELGISDKVLFTGFLRGADIEKAYKMADVYVVPSVSEPFGITPLESISKGTPVILSKQSGVSEVINHCLKVDFWDVNELANKIISVLQYPSLKNCLKEHGLMEVKKITWDAPAQRCIDIYNELLEVKC